MRKARIPAPAVADEASEWDIPETVNEAPVSVAIPEPVEPAEPVAPVTIVSANPDTLPTDLRSALVLLTQLDNAPLAPTRAEQIANRTRLDALRRHIHEMQQGPVAPVLDANTQAATRNHVDAAAQRKYQLAAIKAKLASLQKIVSRH